MSLLIKWVVSTVVFLLAGHIVPGFHVSSLQGAFVAALVLGLLNAIVRPILILFTLPINFLTLGLFTLVINAGMVGLTAYLLKDSFQVDGFFAAFLGALFISLVSTVLNFMIGTDKKKKDD